RILGYYRYLGCGWGVAGPASISAHHASVSGGFTAGPSRSAGALRRSLAALASPRLGVWRLRRGTLTLRWRASTLARCAPLTTPRCLAASPRDPHAPLARLDARSLRSLGLSET